MRPDSYLLRYFQYWSTGILGLLGLVLDRSVGSRQAGNRHTEG